MTLEEFYNSLKDILDRPVVIFKYDSDVIIYNGHMKDKAIDNELLCCDIKKVTVGNTGGVIVFI